MKYFFTKVIDGYRKASVILGIFLIKQLFNILIRSRTVAVGVVNFLIAYIFLLIAFTVSFMIIFPRTESFELLPTAFVKVP